VVIVRATPGFAVDGIINQAYAAIQELDGVVLRRLINLAEPPMPNDPALAARFVGPLAAPRFISHAEDLEPDPPNLAEHSGSWPANDPDRVSPPDAQELAAQQEADDRADDRPAKLALAILVDTSGSMTEVLPAIRRALTQAVGAAEAQAEILIGVWAYSDDLEGAQEIITFSETPGSLAGRRPLSVIFEAGLIPGGGTRLGPAIKRVADALRQRTAERHQLILITDAQTTELRADLRPIFEGLVRRGIRLTTLYVGLPEDRADGLYAQLPDFYPGQVIASFDAYDLEEQLLRLIIGNGPQILAAPADAQES
jgi:hypothetical protein